MTQITSGAAPAMTIGIDIGDRTSRVCILDEHGAVIEEAMIATTPDAILYRQETHALPPTLRYLPRLNDLA